MRKNLGVLDAEERARLGLAPDRPYFEGFDAARVPSPCFVIDRAALQYNLDVLSEVARESGAEILLALKAFSAFSVFDQVRAALPGVCASGLNEARLGRESGFGHVTTFSAAYRDDQIDAILEQSDHVIFNNLGQWAAFRDRALAAREKRPSLSFGLRVNVNLPLGDHPIYDPSAPGSRLGTPRGEFDARLRELFPGSDPHRLPDGLEGIHVHNLCEQGTGPLEKTLEALERDWGDILRSGSAKWLNLGGGHHITKPDYDRARLVEIVRRLRREYGVEVFLEPGEAVAIHTGILVSSVLDVARNGVRLAVLDASAVCHMPDTLEMPYRAEVWNSGEGAFTYRLGSQSCLAGDVMGDYGFPRELERGDRLVFDDMSHYTMVKTNTFNGVDLPSIALWDSRDGSLEVVRSFGYDDFKTRLS